MHYIVSHCCQSEMSCRSLMENVPTIQINPKLNGVLLAGTKLIVKRDDNVAHATLFAFHLIVLL